MRDQEIVGLMEAYSSIYSQSEDCDIVSEARAMSHSVDIFDVILEHLVAEGFADTEEAAVVIMANMSEEWRQSILLELTPLGVKTAGVVDDQRRGSNMAQDMQSIQNTLKKLKPKGPVVTPGGLPGV